MQTPRLGWAQSRSPIGRHRSSQRADSITDSAIMMALRDKHGTAMQAENRFFSTLGLPERMRVDDGWPSGSDPPRRLMSHAPTSASRPCFPTYQSDWRPSFCIDPTRRNTALACGLSLIALRTSTPHYRSGCSMPARPHGRFPPPEKLERLLLPCLHLECS